MCRQRNMPLALTGSGAPAVSIYPVLAAGLARHVERCHRLDNVVKTRHIPPRVHARPAPRSADMGIVNRRLRNEELEQCCAQAKVHVPESIAFPSSSSFLVTAAARNCVTRIARNTSKPGNRGGTDSADASEANVVDGVCNEISFLWTEGSAAMATERESSHRALAAVATPNVSVA